ncbi:MAG: hypothetical protein ACOYJU_09010 [Anaerovoracaceae bacterium]|jgi:hypothetical protein
MIKVTNRKDPKKIYIFEDTRLEWIMGHMIDLLHRAHGADMEAWENSALKGLDILTGSLMGHEIRRGEYSISVEYEEHDE